MSADADVTVVPLTPSGVGAEVRGVDLARLDDEAFRIVRKAWVDHGVIVVRGQSLSQDDQLGFVQRFGPLQEVRTINPGTGHPAVMIVGNVEVNGQLGALPYGEMQFHADQCYYENPAAGTTLYAIEVPPAGGNTRFSDCRRAYDALSDDLKRRLGALTALNVYDYGTNATTRTGESDADAPRFVHPVVRTHPETGEKLIFVNRLMTDHIIGMPREESAALLAELYAAVDAEDHVYEHVWRVGDLVMWDNRTVQHARTDFDPAARRQLRRITLRGDRPY